MKLYLKLLKITFFKAKDTKWIIGAASFVIAMVSMLLTSADSIKASYLQAISQMQQYDFVLEVPDSPFYFSVIGLMGNFQDIINQKTLIMITRNEEMVAYADRIIQVKDGKAEDNNGIRGIP